MKKRVLFCGLGSIGQKHLHNLICIAKEQGMELEIDAWRSQANHPLPSMIVPHISESYYDAAAIPDDYDIVFITNPTSLHYDTILALQSKTKAMFIEKPVFDKPRDLALLDPSVIMYVACPIRHTAILRYVKENIDLSKVFHVRAICSSYLPSWRPTQDYTLSYSAKEEMGGGVELDLIHEWDYLADLFSFPEDVTKMAGKYSALQITSHDIAIYQARQKQRLIELHLDYFGHISRRQLELFTDDNTYLIDINASAIQDKSGNILTIPKEDMYQNELRYFLKLVEGETENINDVIHAQQILGIALK